SDVERQFLLARAQHSASFRAITARQLQAHVRQLALAALFARRAFEELRIFVNAREVCDFLQGGHRGDRVRDEPALARLRSCSEEILQAAQRTRTQVRVCQRAQETFPDGRDVWHVEVTEQDRPPLEWRDDVVDEVIDGINMNTSGS